MTTVLEVGQATGRCPIRAEVGHRCNQRIAHDGPHSAFGHTFTSGVVIAKVKR